jgi:cyclohexa-1,5-dienecarbonyl-CoA hydratase
MPTTLIDAKLTRISVEVAGTIARITLTNPPVNVIDIPMMEELTHVLGELESQPRISAVLFQGKGRAFSAGVDIAAHTPDKVEYMLSKFHTVIRSVLGCKKVTLASVHGLCLGGGAELAMVCDVVYTSDDAEWGFPEIKLGCFPPVACAALAGLIGQKRAAELILTGRSIDGTEAAGIGLATRAVTTSQLESTVQAAMAQLIHLSAAALRVAKKASYAWDAMHFDKGLARAEKTYLEDLMKTADAQEGIRAFLEKRPPKWRGE